MLKPETEENQKVEGNVAKKIRHRSPNYPAVGLRDAVDRASKFLQADGKAGAPPEIAATHIGFSKAHGQAMSVLSALKKFGLIQEAKGRVVPTQRAIEIINLPEGDHRRLKALREAAISPEIYKELIGQHKETGFPSNDAMERELITYKEFNPKSVGPFVRDFKDSLEFACLSDLKALDLVEEEPGMPALETSTADPKMPHQANPQVRIPKAPEVRDVPLPVTGTVWPTLRGAFPMKEEEWNQMMALLQAMKPGLVLVKAKESEGEQ